MFTCPESIYTLDTVKQKNSISKKIPFTTHPTESQVYYICCFLRFGISDTRLLLHSLPNQSATHSLSFLVLLRIAHPNLASQTPAASVNIVYIILY